MVIKRIIKILTICIVVVTFTIPCFASSIITDDSNDPYTSTGNFIIGISESQDNEPKSNRWAWIVADGTCLRDYSAAYETATSIDQYYSNDIKTFNPQIRYPHPPEKMKAPSISIVDEVESARYTQWMRFSSRSDDISFRYLKFALYDFWIIPGDMTESGIREMTRNIKIDPAMSSTAIVKDVEMVIKVEGITYNYELSTDEIRGGEVLIDSELINLNKIASEIEAEYELEHNYLADKIMQVEKLVYNVSIGEFSDEYNNAIFDMEYKVRVFTDINQVIKAKSTSIEIPDSKDPIGYTNWLGTAVSGFFNTEILPGFTFGGILLMIISFLSVMWFLKIFAGG